MKRRGLVSGLQHGILQLGWLRVSRKGNSCLEPIRL